MSKVICVKCNRQMRPEHNGEIVLENHSDYTTPYKLWMADLYKCPVCGIQVVTGFASNPRAEHYQEYFKEQLEEAKTKKGKDLIQF